MGDSSFKLEVKGNWKLAVENYLESYHLPWVHPGLNSYSKLEDHENIVEYGHYSGQISYKYIPQYTTGKQFDHLSVFSALIFCWLRSSGVFFFNACSFSTAAIRLASSACCFAIF